MNRTVAIIDLYRTPNTDHRSQWLTIEPRRIAPQLGIHGIFVNVSRSHHGHHVSLAPHRTVSLKNGDTP